MTLLRLEEFISTRLLVSASRSSEDPFPSSMGSISMASTSSSSLAPSPFCGLCFNSLLGFFVGTAACLGGASSSSLDSPKISVFNDFFFFNTFSFVMLPASLTEELSSCLESMFSSSSSSELPNRSLGSGLDRPAFSAWSNGDNDSGDRVEMLWRLYKPSHHWSDQRPPPRCQRPCSSSRDCFRRPPPSCASLAPAPDRPPRPLRYSEP